MENKQVTNQDLMQAIEGLYSKIDKQISELSYKLDKHIENYDIIVLGEKTGGGIIQDVANLKKKFPTWKITRTISRAS